MNRCGTRSLWTPAAAISPKEQTNHPGFQIWAGYSVSLKLEDPSLHRAWVFGDNAALFRYNLLREAVAHSLQTLRINWSSYEMATCIDKEAHVSLHIHTCYHLLPPTSSIPYSASFPFLCQARWWNHPPKNFQQSMRSESQFLPVPMATRKTENWTVGDVVFFFFTGLTLLVLVVSLILHLISFLFIKTSQKHIDRVTSFTKVTRHRHTISKQRKKEAERYTTKNHETRRWMTKSQKTN